MSGKKEKQKRSQFGSQKRRSKHQSVFQREGTLWIAGSGVFLVGLIAFFVLTAPTPPTSVASSVHLGHLSTLGLLENTPPLGPLGAEGIPIALSAQLATVSSAATGNTIDHIKCDTNEQTVYHHHVHLTIFVNGKQMQIPFGIGIPGAVVSGSGTQASVGNGSCFYWLHTHADDGIIHIESPTSTTYSLGDFFDIWGQPLSNNQIGPAKGKVVVMYNGKRFIGNPRTVPLNELAQIQLEVGTPLVAPEVIQFPSGL
jgi:hypothetical protein